MPEPTQPSLEPEDAYFDGPFLVFTAAYHRKRGYCCGNGCRHCPYDPDGTLAADFMAPSQEQSEGQT